MEKVLPTKSTGVMGKEFIPFYDSNGQRESICFSCNHTDASHVWTLFAGERLVTHEELLCFRFEAAITTAHETTCTACYSQHSGLL